MSVAALHRAAMPAAGQQHLDVIENLMSAQSIQVMGLTEAHDPGFVEVLAQAQPAGRCLHSATKKCALLCDEANRWQEGDSDTLSAKFNKEKVDEMREDEDVKLHDAVAGRLVGSSVLHIVAYGQSNLKTKEDMSFLGQIVEWCEENDCFETGVVLMGDWNTVNEKAQDEVTRILRSHFVMPDSLLETSNKERTYCSEQMYKAHEVVDTAKDYVFVSKLVGGDSGGTEQQRFYVSAEKNKITPIHQADRLKQLPLPKLHFSDHVVLATSWKEGTKPRKTGTLNVMSGPYNSLEFVGPVGSLSFKVDQALSGNIDIAITDWNCWIYHMINGALRWPQHCNLAQRREPENWNVVSQLESFRAGAGTASVHIWDALLEDNLRGTILSLEHLSNMPNIRNIGKRYALAHGQYRPDLTSFHNGTSGSAQDNLAKFQSCVDELTVDNLHKWVAAMLDAVKAYKKKGGGKLWEPDGIYATKDYTYTFAQHAATCLMVGVWMIVCLQQLKRLTLNVHFVTLRILGSSAKLRF